MLIITDCFLQPHLVAYYLNNILFLQSSLYFYANLNAVSSEVEGDAGHAEPD